MRLYIVLRYLGVLISFNAVFLYISAAISLIYSDGSFYTLFYSGVITTLAGLFLIILCPSSDNISNKEGLIISVLGWLITCFIGVMPYVMFGGDFNFTNAWFESVSGYTTTGATILTNIEMLPKGLLFFRSATHWIGGIGILFFVLAILPLMGNYKMTLYKIEVSPLSSLNTINQKTSKILKIIVSVYIGLTVLETIALYIAGMNLFDAVTHSFATIATGGFSTKNLSISSFNSLSIEIIIMFFMLLSGIHFGLLFYIILKKFKKFWSSSIMKYYLLSILFGIIFVTINVNGNIFHDVFKSLRYSAFQVISLGSTTGFATYDSSFWPPFSILILIFFTLQCGCAGSTSGGIKADRIYIFLRSIKRRLKIMEHPNAIIPLRIDNHVINNELINASMLYILLYLFIVFISSIILTLLGVDIMTSFSSVVACIGNVGPGFGQVGSLASYSNLPDIAKWVLSFDMIIGRLEIFSIFMFLTLKTWR